MAKLEELKQQIQTLGNKADELTKKIGFRHVDQQITDPILILKTQVESILTNLKIMTKTLSTKSPELPEQPQEVAASDGKALIQKELDHILEEIESQVQNYSNLMDKMRDELEVDKN